MRQLHDDLEEEVFGGWCVWPVLVGAVAVGMFIVMVARCVR